MKDVLEKLRLLDKFERPKDHNERAFFENQRKFYKKSLLNGIMDSKTEEWFNQQVEKLNKN
jgi:hypothetical protein